MLRLEALQQSHKPLRGLQGRGLPCGHGLVQVAQQGHGLSVGGDL
jgi:hypothetical protein